MSASEINIELNNNNRMQEIIKNIDYIFGIIIYYSIIILTMLSVLLGGIFACPIYAAIYIFNKLEDKCLKKKEVEDKIDTDVEQDQDKKPIIDDNWCNISEKNIINYQRKTYEKEYNESEEEDDEEDDKSEAEEDDEEEAEAEDDKSEAESEILSLKMPECTCSSDSESESESESEDTSPNDKYSLCYKEDQVDLTQN